MIYLYVVCFSVCLYVHFYLKFSILKFEDGQFLSVPHWASHVKSWRNTKRVPVPENKLSFQCRNREHT